MVVTKVVGRIEREILVLVFLGQTQGNTALKDEIEFAEVFQAAHNSLIGYKYSTIERRHEESEEFVARLQPVIVLEQMFKVFDHGREELLDEFVAQARLHLIQKVVAINQFVVVVCQRLLNVDLDFVVENPWQGLAHS